MMRIRISKRFESDQPHEFVHFGSFFAQHTARNQANLDVAANGEPRKQIRILKNKTTFRARSDDSFFADEQLAGIRKIETGDKAKRSEEHTSELQSQSNL